MKDMSALVVALFDSRQSVRIAAQEAVLRMEPDDLPALVDALKGKSADIRRTLAEEFCSVHSAVLPFLIAALNDERHVARIFAAEALVSVGFFASNALPTRGDAVRALVGALGDPDDRVRSGAAGAMESLASFVPPVADDIVPALIAALDDDNEDVWYPANRALRCSGPAAVPALIAALHVQSEELRWKAADVLDNIGRPAAESALPALIAALNDESSIVRYHVCRALAHFQPVAFSALVKGLHDHDENVRASAACSLGGFGLDAEPVLLGALRDESAEVRYYAALAISRIEPVASETVAALITLLADRSHVDENIRVCNAAADALERIGPPAAIPAVPALIAAFQEDDWDYHRDYIRAVANIGSGAVPELIEALHHENWRVRAGAARILGRVGYDATDAVPALIATLSDERDEVVSEAKAALRDIDPDWSLEMGRPSRPEPKDRSEGGNGE